SVKLASDPSVSVLAYPKAWTPGTNGPVTAEAVEAVIQSEADFARLRGKLRGKFAMILPAPPAPPPAQTTVKRFTDEELLALGSPQAPAAAPTPTQAAATPRPSPATPSTAEPAVAAAPAAPEAATGFFAWVENALSAEPAQPTGPVKTPAQPAPITRERV